MYQYAYLFILCAPLKNAVMLGHVSCCLSRAFRYGLLAFLASAFLGKSAEFISVLGGRGGGGTTHNAECSMEAINLFDYPSGKLGKLICNLFILQVSQELNITERDPNYQNPYSRSHKKGQNKEQSVQQNTVKKNRKKEYKKGPRMSSGTFTGEL